MESKIKISNLVVVVVAAMVVLMLVPSAFARCKNNNNNNIKLLTSSSDQELVNENTEVEVEVETDVATLMMKKIAKSSPIDQVVSRMLARQEAEGLRRNDGCSGSSCNVLNDPCCGGCHCAPVGILVGVCVGSCC
ncbi:hypothetical protein CsatB_018636 [Cannabis sativa]